MQVSHYSKAFWRGCVACIVDDPFEVETFSGYIVVTVFVDSGEGRLSYNTKVWPEQLLEKSIRVSSNSEAG